MYFAHCRINCNMNSISRKMTRHTKCIYFCVFKSTIKNAIWCFRNIFQWYHAAYLWNTIKKWYMQPIVSLYCRLIVNYFQDCNIYPPFHIVKYDDAVTAMWCKDSKRIQGRNGCMSDRQCLENARGQCDKNPDFLVFLSSSTQNIKNRNSVHPEKWYRNGDHFSGVRWRKLR